MNNPLISIIVPVYNVEKFIRECLDSVRHQSYQEWEMILVDDGSPDKCPEICDEYARLDSRIKVFHQDNGELSLARNAGICNARGEYLYSLDSDDLLPDDALKSLVEKGAEYGWPEYIKGSHYVLMPDNKKIITRFTPPEYAHNQPLISKKLYVGYNSSASLGMEWIDKKRFVGK